jgi:hypothetical protein
LILCDLTARTLKLGLELLGIKVLGRMWYKVCSCRVRESDKYLNLDDETVCTHAPPQALNNTDVTGNKIILTADKRW